MTKRNSNSLYVLQDNTTVPSHTSKAGYVLVYIFENTLKLLVSGHLGTGYCLSEMSVSDNSIYKQRDSWFDQAS